MSWSPWLTTLNDVLADLYPTQKESRRIVACADMKAALIEFDDMALVNWFNILQFAQKSHGSKPGHPAKALAILDCALKDHGDNDILLALKRDEPPVLQSPSKLDWVAPTDEAHLEKIIGAQSTLLPVRFLELGMKRARSVARVVRSDRSSGTGFLIGKGWLLTNNHVLPTQETAQGAVAEMNYQQTVDGLDAAVERFALHPTRFHTSEANDWTAIGVDPGAETWGTIELVPAETAADRYVNIIQHPGGGPKQIGLYHNTVAYAGEGRVQYLTDTLPGSSGAPVFDDQWRVVALHHSGGMLREPGTKKTFYRNEGIAIATVIADLRACGVLG